MRAPLAPGAAALSLCLALQLGALEPVESALPSCCNDPILGPLEAAKCTCLEGDRIFRAMLAAGQEKRFHWVVTNETTGLLSRPDVDRKITFMMSPCVGTAHLLVNSASRKGFPTNETAQFRAHNPGAPSAITVPLDAAHFFVTVLAETDANVSISALTRRACLAPGPTRSSLQRCRRRSAPHARRRRDDSCDPCPRRRGQRVRARVLYSVRRRNPAVHRLRGAART